MSPRRSRVARINPDLLYRTRVIGGGLWSPEGEWIAFTMNASGRHNIYLVPSSGGWPLQLTVSDQRQAIGDWSPDGEWIAYQSDYDGNEQWDLFVVSTRTGEIRNLTGTPGISEENPRFSPDRKRLAYIAKPKTGSSYEVCVMSWPGAQARTLTLNTPPEWSHSGPVWSQNGRRLAFTRTRADHKASEVWMADVRTGRSERITPEGDALWRLADFAPDSSSLLVTSDALNRYSNVALVTADGNVRWLTRETWECEAGEFDRSGRRVAWEINRDGNYELWVTELSSGRSRPVAAEPGVNGSAPGGFSPDGKRILCYYSGAREPSDIHVRDVSSRRAVRVTNSNLAPSCAGDLVEPQLVRYVSAGGIEVPAWVYVPYNLRRDGTHPGIVHVHGGPASQVVNGFQRGIQYFVNNGYVVIAPNYRGSTGYGKDYEELNRFDMGGGDLHDVVGAARFLAATGFVDPRRIAVAGGSYGGYITMLALGKTPEVWAAGVAIVPFVNWFTEIENEDPILRQWDLATMGDPVANRALYQERSPITYIDQIRAPVLILAGANDPRCPKSESDQVVKAIRSRGGVVEYKFYENEGHGFSRTENAVDSFRRTVEFLDRVFKK